VRQYKPLPANLQLAPTLARRVNELRDMRNLTVRDLAHMTRFPLRRIEDIEAGLETWLSATDRQRLSIALGIEPGLLLEVESRSAWDAKASKSAADADLALTDAILNGARQLNCPQCGSQLNCSVQQALDFEGNPTRFAKAFCSKCPYVLK
jgi:transcriptional regulator with XRE-family HTH domain